MSDELSIQPGKDEAAVVERVVPGKLVYVRTANDSPPETYRFKLNQLLIRKADGLCRPYRGEPLSVWGIDKGRKVVVWGIRYRDVTPALVIDADRPHEFVFSVGNSISTAANTAVNVVTSTVGTAIEKLFK